MYKRVFPGGGLQPQPLHLAPLDSKSAANVPLYFELQRLLIYFFTFLSTFIFLFGQLMLPLPDIPLFANPLSHEEVARKLAREVPSDETFH